MRLWCLGVFLLFLNDMAEIQRSLNNKHSRLRESVKRFARMDNKPA